MCACVCICYFRLIIQRRSLRRYEGIKKEQEPFTVIKVKRIPGTWNSKYKGPKAGMLSEGSKLSEGATNAKAE